VCVTVTAPISSLATTIPPCTLNTTTTTSTKTSTTTTNKTTTITITVDVPINTITNTDTPFAPLSSTLAGALLQIPAYTKLQINTSVFVM
jgi:hypothetical protein